MAGELFKVALSMLLLFILVDGSDMSCKQDSSNPCACKGSGFKIDISKLLHFPVTIQGEDNGKGGHFKYKVDLCKGISCHGDDSSVGCQIGGTQEDKPYNFSLGKLSSAKWTVSQKSPLQFKVEYEDGDASEPTGGGQSIPRSAKFIFDQNKSYKKSSIVKESSDGKTLLYTFNVDVKISSGSSGGGSGGSKIGLAGLILIILLLVAVVVYLVGGGVYMYKFRGARGVEVIPNWMFWKELPFIVKDGCVFTFGPCVRKIRGNQYSYEKI